METNAEKIAQINQLVYENMDEKRDDLLTLSMIKDIVNNVVRDGLIVVMEADTSQMTTE